MDVEHYYYKQGYDSARGYTDMKGNPYREGSGQHTLWEEGWSAFVQESSKPLKDRRAS